DPDAGQDAGNGGEGGTPDGGADGGSGGGPIAVDAGPIVADARYGPPLPHPLLLPHGGTIPLPPESGLVPPGLHRPRDVPLPPPTPPAPARMPSHAASRSTDHGQPPAIRSHSPSTRCRPTAA